MFNDRFVVQIVLWIAAGVVLRRLLLRRRAQKLGVRSDALTVIFRVWYHSAREWLRRMSVAVADQCGWLSFVDRPVIDAFWDDVAQQKLEQEARRAENASDHAAGLVLSPTPAGGRGVRILIYSDEPILAKGFESALRQVEGFNILPTCDSLASLWGDLAGAAPDLFLMDLTPEVDFAVLSRLKSAMLTTNVVLWVNTIPAELAFQAMGLGVRGILRKTLPTDLQVKCLQKVHAGELWFEKALTDGFLSARRVALTQREGQIISLLARGLKDKEIATTLMISEGTVKVYLARLFQRVGVRDRFELALFGLKNLTTGNLPASKKGQTAGTSMPGLRSLILEKPLDSASKRDPKWQSDALGEETS